MIKFEINNEEHILPSSVTIQNYVEIYKIKDLFSDDYFAAKLLSIVTNISIEDLLMSDYNQVNYLASEVMKMIPIDKPEFVDRIEIDGIKYGFIPDWKDMTFAEFADLDTLTTKKRDEVLSNLHIIASIMYRPVTTEKSLHDYEIEKYDVKKMKERAEIFKNKLDIKYVLGAQFFFYQIRKQVFKLFPSVFDTEIIDMDKNENVMDDEEINPESNFQKAYGWFFILNRIAGNDYKNHKVIYESTIMECLNQLSYLVDYDREQIRLQKKHNNIR